MSMQTILLKADAPETVEQAAAILKQGGLVAIPTETVYGLGANGLDAQAVHKIFEAKGRPQDNPLILHIAEIGQLEDICHDIPKEAYTLAEQFWPGPLTLVLPCRELVPRETTAGLPTVAVRCPRQYGDPTHHCSCRCARCGAVRQSFRSPQPHHSGPYGDGYGRQD